MPFDSRSRRLGDHRAVAHDTHPARWPIITLILLASLTFFAGLGRQAITESDEAFYAEAAREMVAGGDWITPHFNFEERWEKPILYYWVTAAAFAGTDVSEFMARLGAALSGLGLVLLTFAAARHLIARIDTAWIAGAIVATCYGAFTMGRSSLPDLPLAFFITGTIYASLRAADPKEPLALSWAALAGLSAGLGFLTKGPIALVVPSVVVFPIWWRERSKRSFVLRAPHILLAVVLFAIAALPWYIAMTWTHGAAYLQSFFVGDNLERFATTRFNGPRSIFFYIPIVVGGMVPWSAFIAVFPWRPLRGLVRHRHSLSDVHWRLLIWTFSPLLLFTASVGKQPRYILPMLPPIAMMLGDALFDRIRSAETPSARRELSISTLTTAAIFIVFAALVYRARPLLVTAIPALTWVGIAGLGCAAVALLATVASGAWNRLPLVMTLASAVFLLTLQFGAFAGRRPEAVEEMAAMIRVNRLGGEPVGEYDALVRNLVFYTHLRQVDIADDASALAFLKSPDRVFLVIGKDNLQRLEALDDAPIHRLGEVTYLNTARVRLRTLLVPLPEQDLETVVLVSNR